MKRISTLILVLLIGLKAFSQSYSLASDSSFTTDDFANITPGIAMDAAPINLTINFTGSPSITTKWVRNNHKLPAGWQTSVCDLTACYDTAGSYQNEFMIDAAMTGGTHTITGPIYVDFYPSSTGLGVTNLHLFDKNNPADSLNATFVGTVLGSSGVSKVVRVKDIFLAPVPAKENLSIIYDASIHPVKAEVYDILGKLKTSINILNDGSLKAEVNVAGLEKGLYFLRVYIADGKVLTRQFSKD